jgi:hypothetical protein
MLAIRQVMLAIRQIATAISQEMLATSQIATAIGQIMFAMSQVSIAIWQEMLAIWQLVIAIRQVPPPLTAHSPETRPRPNGQAAHRDCLSPWRDNGSHCHTGPGAATPCNPAPTS